MKTIIASFFILSLLAGCSSMHDQTSTLGKSGIGQSTHPHADGGSGGGHR